MQALGQHACNIRRAMLTAADLRTSPAAEKAA